MTDKQYNEIPAVRRSALWEIRKSPMHYKYAIEHPEEPTEALRFGIAAHKFILEPETFFDEFVTVPKIDRRTKAGKEEWAELLASGKEFVTESDMDTIRAMDAAIMAHPTANALLKTGRHEVAFQWLEGTTNEPCKCRADCLTEYKGNKYIVDYKTTTSCEDGAFERACRSYGYKLQAAMYTDGVFNQTFEEYGFAFVAQEKKPPYAVRVYFCDPGFIEEGLELFKSLIGTYHECRLSGEWPGYEDEEIYGDE
jgi:hypothetical protein